MAQMKAKKVVEELIKTANQTVKAEMTNILKQFNKMSKDLFLREKELQK